MKSIVVIFLLLSIGSSLVAEQAIPGNLLYPMKVKVNEQVKGIFAKSFRRDVEYQAELLAERLYEVEALARDGRLKGQVAKDAQAAVNAQVEKTLTVSDGVATGGASELSMATRLALNEKLTEFKTTLEDLIVILDEKVAAEIAADIDAQIRTVDISLDGSIDATTTPETAISTTTDMGVTATSTTTFATTTDSGVNGEDVSSTTNETTL